MRDYKLSKRQNIEEVLNTDSKIINQKTDTRKYKN